MQQAVHRVRKMLAMQLELDCKRV